MSAGRTINSKSQSWGTPKKYVDAITNFFDNVIDFDPCSNDFSIVNAKTEIKLPIDGLSIEWNYKTIFVNPPYGADRVRGTTIKNWLFKIFDSASNYDNEILALIPVATNTSHWKKYVFGVANAICFLSDTRLKFLENGVEGGKGAPMACAIVYWGCDYKKFYRIFKEFGAIVELN